MRRSLRQSGGTSSRPYFHTPALPMKRCSDRICQPFESGKSDTGDDETAVDSGISVRSTLHQAPQITSPRGEYDDDLNRAVIAFKYIDIHQREIDRIMEGRPDLRSFDFQGDADVASDEENSNSGESETGYTRSPCPELGDSFLFLLRSWEKRRPISARTNRFIEYQKPGRFSPRY